MLTEREEQINKLPYGDLVRSHDEGSLMMFVDRTLAMQAASSGLPVSPLATITAIGMPVAIVAAVVLGIFWSIWAAIAALIVSVTCFRISRAETLRSVRKAALKNRDLFEILRKNKAIWFEEVAR